MVVGGGILDRSRQVLQVGSLRPIVDRRRTFPTGRSLSNIIFVRARPEFTEAWVNHCDPRGVNHLDGPAT
ncbi:hypothetical protein Msi02_32930 [Microbispora siamensis]|uniref:Uncharacterized protein n=1 Tax=Microbispora siamensis TaxID=564413 RepID=A0ABQ4GM30_9ACTN|nr:hypothetical protein Msi02_32930 [Microbispora siamensis]